MIFVDTPAQDRADVLATVCGEADYCTIVTGREQASGAEVEALAQRLSLLSGNLAGIVINDPPASREQTFQYVTG